MSAGRVVVVGAGSSGLRAALGLARRGHSVDLFSLREARHEPAASAGRTLAAGEDVEAHVADVLAVAGGLVAEGALRSMIRASPAYVEELVDLGVPLGRSPEGQLVRHGGAGHAEPRLLDADLATRMHVVRALDDALRAFAPGARGDRGGEVRRLAGWELVALAQDAGGAVVGIVAQDLRTMELRSFPALAVVLASGGFARLWAPSTAVSTSTGAATVAAVKAGAALADAELVEVVPAAEIGPDKARAMPEALRDLGAVLWVPRDPRERRRPRDVPAADRVELLPRESSTMVMHRAAREVVALLSSGEQGVFDPTADALLPRAYFDVRGVDPVKLGARLGTGRAGIERSLGVDLGKEPLLVGPALHATLGGLWVDVTGDVADHHHATNLPGLFAIGGATHAYQGEARLSGHRLLTSLHGGASVAHAVDAFVRGREEPSADRSSATLAATLRREEKTWAGLLARTAGGDDTPDAIAADLGEAMWRGAGLVRDDRRLGELRESLARLEARAASAPCPDRSPFANRSAPALRRLDGLLVLARFVVAGARRQEASRGAEVEPEASRGAEVEPAVSTTPGAARFRRPARARWVEGDVVFEVGDG